MDKKIININLIKYGIISMIIGLIYIIAGLYIWDIFLEDWAVAMAVEGFVFTFISCGLLTKHILPNRNWIFLLGFLLGIIGIIIAICIKQRENKKDNYKGNKYEELERLNKLRETGILTDAEFDMEKTKLLK